MRTAILALLLIACSESDGDDTSSADGSGGTTSSSLTVGEWYAVSPSFPMPNGPIAAECVPPHCEMAIRLDDNGDITYSESGQGTSVRGTWDSTSSVTVDGKAADVEVADQYHPSYSLWYGSSEVRITTWPYEDPPHDRVPGSID